MKLEFGIDFESENFCRPHHFSNEIFNSYSSGYGWLPFLYFILLITLTLTVDYRWRLLFFIFWELTLGDFKSVLLGVFWVKIAKNGVCCCYKYCSKLFGKIMREIEPLPKLKEKVHKSGERENWISVMRLPKFLSCLYCQACPWSAQNAC